MGTIEDILRGAWLDASNHLATGVGGLGVAIAVMISIDLKNLFVRWRLERRLEVGIDLTWEDVQYLKARLEVEGEVERSFKPREALRNMLAHVAMYSGLGIIFALGTKLDFPGAYLGLGAAALVGGRGVWQLTHDLKKALDYYDAQEIRRNSILLLIFAGVIAAFSLIALFV